MKESTPKEQILSKIRNALIEKQDNPYQNNEFSAEVVRVSNPEEEAEIIFARELIQSGGEFVYCENEQVFLDHLTELMQANGWTKLWCQNPRINALLMHAEIPYSTVRTENDRFLISLTSCEKLVATIGSVVVSDTDAGSREIFSLADIHLVMAYSTQVVMTIKSATQALNVKYPSVLPPQITFITGPSRTADIEKTLVKGAHGPKALYVFLIDDR